jgi:hypothetical protein
VWWAASRVVEAYLGTTRLGIRPPRAPVAWFEVSSAEAAVDRLERTLLEDEVVRGKRLRVWLSAALARPFIVPMDSGAQSDDEARAVAEASVIDETGMSESCAVWLDAWRKDRDALAVAVPAAVLRQIRAACGRTKVRLSSVKPWWTLAVDAAANAANVSDVVLWSLREDDGMTWGRLESGVVARAECVLPSSQDPDWTHSRQRTRLAAGLKAAQWHAKRAANGGELQGLPIGAWLVDPVDSSAVGRGSS